MDVTFILVRPEYAGNMGGAARAAANFGFRRLAFVKPRHSPHHREAMKYAMKAQTLLENAQVTETLLAATQGLEFVIGTSRRPREVRYRFHPLEEIGGLLRPLQGRKVGLLFGAETKGLTNAELGHCQAVVTIPTDPRCPSINLAHAVALVAYEVQRTLGGQCAKGVPEGPRFATADLRAGMFAKLECLLHTIGFFEHGSRTKVMLELRHLVDRAMPTYHETQMLWAIWQKALWGVETGRRGGAETEKI